MHRCARDDSLSRSMRGAEAAPHGFLRARFRPRRVIGAPPPRRSGSHAGRVCRPESQAADAKCCIGHCDGRIAARKARRARATDHRSSAARRCAPRAALPLPAMKPHCHAALLFTFASAHAPKAANISQTPYRRKAAVFASLEDGTAVLFSGKTKDARVNNGSDLRVLKCRDAFTPSTCIVSRNDGSGWSLFRF